MTEIPESLLRRSAEAKAKALGLPFEQVLAEMKGEVASTETEPNDNTTADTQGSASGPETSDSPVVDTADTDQPNEEPTPEPSSTPTVEELARAVARQADKPEVVILRDAQQQAEERGVTLTTVLTEMASGASIEITEAEPIDQTQPTPSAPDPVKLAELAQLAVDKQGVPEVVVRRTAQEESTARGVPPAQILAELAGVDWDTFVESSPEDSPFVTPSISVPSDFSASESTSTDTELHPEKPEPSAVSEEPVLTPGSTDPEELIAAIVASSGLPEAMVRRSAEAKAKAMGVEVSQVLAEMAGVEPASTSEAGTEPATEETTEADSSDSVPPPDQPKLPPASIETPPPPPPIPITVSSEEDEPGRLVDRPAATVLTEERPTVSPSGNGHSRTATIIATPTDVPHEDLPEQVRIQRLLTVVRSEAIQQVKAEPTDKVTTWPHLVLAEFVSLLVMTAFVVLLSVILQAPLLEAANPNLTPNPSKAPWYFLGLQELLSYFDPQIAGVTIPTLAGMFGFMMIPYIDRNPSTKPSDRKLAIMLYTIFLMGSATLTILGVLFRGQGFNFSYPWKDGVFFDDLKDWVNFE